jgi:ribosome maturation factor RimP
MATKDKILELVSDTISEEGFEIVELKLARYKNSSRIQFFLDSDNGIKIDDCARISKLVAPILDSSGLFRYGYTIEVSSPGLDRPLSVARDFRRRIGEDIEITFNDTATVPIRGKLIEADDRYICLETAEGKSRYDLADIKVGKIIF